MYFLVVIPLYNKEEHIRRAIHSVLAKTHQEFEVIVVDDGSTDSSYEEVKRPKDARVKVIIKQNGGVASARNHGIWYASYDYIGFLDADDAWKPDFLAIINDLIKKYPRAGAYGAAYEFVHSMPVLNAQRLHLIYTIVQVAAAA